MTHLWIRSEPRDNERRVCVMPRGAAELIASGMRVTVEESAARIVPVAEYRDAGAEVAPEGSWPEAPIDAVICGLKELPDDGTPLRHRHIMFGHAFKGQPDGPALLRRFAEGGGTLLDLESLEDDAGRRVAAFGYWAGYAGAAVTLLAWAAQQRGAACAPVTAWETSLKMQAHVMDAFGPLGSQRPSALIVGAKGRAGRGVADFCLEMGMPVTGWDVGETQRGGPFPEIGAHDIFFNCVLANRDTPVFVPLDLARPALRVIGDISCDPGSDYNPVPHYDAATSWAEPATRVTENPPLDIVAIDNLPSLLPLESSADFASELLPHLLSLPDGTVWERARARFDQFVPG